MKILMLTPLLPYPLLSGGQIRSYNLIRELSRSHQITLFSFIRNEEEKRFLPQLQKYCHEIKVFKRRQAFSLFNILLSGFSYYPFLMSTYWDPYVKRAIEEELGQNKYDLVHAETFYIAHLLPLNGVPIVLSEQNIEYHVYQRFVEKANLFFKPFLSYDVLKMKIWEEFFWQKVKKIVVASTLDKQVIEKKVKKGIDLVPNGVDVDYFKNLEKKPHRFPKILFVGNFKWMQNRDAVKFLVCQIWPKIREKISGVELLVVGRDAPEKLKSEIKKSGAVLKEDVAEIKEIYREVDLLLAPIRIGGGTKFKILEAMVAGIPVVTTKEGIEGLKVRDGQEVLVGEEASELVKKGIEILKDEILRKNLVTRAQALVSENYDWQKIGKDLDRVWREARHV